MTAHRWPFAALVLLAACATSSMQEQPLAPADMPVRLSLAGLSDPTPELRRLYDSRAGTDVRIMQLATADQFAIVAYLTTVGDYVFTRRSARNWVGAVLPEEMAAKAAWGGAGAVDDSGGRTEWQGFDLADNARCIGLSRPLRQHYEAAGRGEASQEMVVAIYCRAAAAPLDEAVARELAAAIRMTG